jgi:uncharacterized LabA/DUF88 family protein
MCQLLLPKNQILKIKYFTARVQARPNDPNQPARQDIYLRALRTLPNVEIIFGSFLASQPWMLEVGTNRRVKVHKTEEKGSDVNIAAHMIHNGHQGLYDVAVLVSNDSDLVEPVKIVRYELGFPVIVLNPYPKPSYQLQQHANFVKPIRNNLLAACQFRSLPLGDDKSSVQQPLVNFRY